jgi:hypothetical protein
MTLCASLHAALGTAVAMVRKIRTDRITSLSESHHQVGSPYSLSLLSVLLNDLVSVLGTLHDRVLRVGKKLASFPPSFCS